MKRSVFAALFFTLLLSMMVFVTSCNNGGENPNASSAANLSSGLVSSSQLSSESVSFSDKSDLTYADIQNMEFWFGSGAGGWHTTLKIATDGTFSGYYSDTDMGDIGPKYPNGTKYECYFSGKFSPLVKAGAYTYSMKCISLETKGKDGEEKITDGVKVITSHPYGLDEAGDFFLYLPGKNTSELTEDFLSWGTRWSVKDGILTAYGLYNAGGKEGFTVLED